MEANGVSKEHRDNVFHFKGGESFDIHDAPGKSKSEKTLNTYILTGLGKFLASGSRNYDNDTARTQSSAVTTREAIQTILKAQGNEFSGDKKQGYTLTTPELKRGAPLVKNWRV